jgi:hypothetical protein
VQHADRHRVRQAAHHLGKGVGRRDDALAVHTLHGCARHERDDDRERLGKGLGQHDQDAQALQNGLVRLHVHAENNVITRNQVAGLEATELDVVRTVRKRVVPAANKPPAGSVFGHAKPQRTPGAI